MARSLWTRADIAKAEAARMANKQAAMSPRDIGRLMRRVAHEALDKNGVVLEADFIRANVPKGSIAMRGKAIIHEVLHERAHGGIHQ